MATTTMNVSLPESMKAFIDARLADDEYGTASEYVRELIRADQKRREEQKLERLLLNRLQTAAGAELDIEEVRAELYRRRNSVREIDGLRKMLYSKYGKMPDSVELIREDRQR